MKLTRKRFYFFVVRKDVLRGKLEKLVETRLTSLEKEFAGMKPIKWLEPHSERREIVLSSKGTLLADAWVCGGLPSFGQTLRSRPQERYKKTTQNGKGYAIDRRRAFARRAAQSTLRGQTKPSQDGAIPTGRSLVTRRRGGNDIHFKFSR